MEDVRVFRESHGLILKWVREGVLDGLRIDHPDGLLDPSEYFQRLHEAAPESWIVVEKILEPGEVLPEDWPVAGTTGYDFLNRLGGLFIDPTGEGAITDFYASFTGESVDYLAMVREKKLFVLKEMFGSDVNRLVNLLSGVCEGQKRYRDYTRRELTAMVREVIACFPVYRTYVQAERGFVSDADSRYINEAIEAAKANRPEIGSDLFEFLRDLLHLKRTGVLESQFVMRFQQSTEWSHSTRSAATRAGSGSPPRISTRPASKPSGAGQPR
jgi:(1->4)-alpha-D-glucan 1-alpha-D-glucosylmutase